MDLIDLVFSNLSYVFLPISLYFFYVVYKRTYNEKESGLIFVLVIYSILYIEFKYGTFLFEGMPIILLNIPLIIAMIKNQKTNIIILSLILIGYSYYFFNNYLFLIVLEYVLYFLFYLKHKDNIYNALLYICLVKMIMTSIYMGYKYLSIDYLFASVLETIVFYLISIVVIYVFKEGEVLFKVFLSVKDIQQNKQIQNSLFKISHEIKNPIAVCKGYLDMFDVNNKEHAQKYVPIIKEEIDRTLLILEDFLAMNKLKIQKDILDINVLLEEVINKYRPIFRKNNISLSSKILDEEIYINGDYNRLMQVIINILKNSIEAKDENKKMVMNIYTKMDNDYIYLNFWDNGIGISKENLKKIKEPFFTTKIGGTGLGTSLSSEIIDAHGGCLDFESKEGEYTLVTIRLPLEKF